MMRLTSSTGNVSISVLCLSFPQSIDRAPLRLRTTQSALSVSRERWQNAVARHQREHPGPIDGAAQTDVEPPTDAPLSPCRFSTVHRVPNFARHWVNGGHTRQTGMLFAQAQESRPVPLTVWRRSCQGCAACQMHAFNGDWPCETQHGHTYILSSPNSPPPSVLLASSKHKCVFDKRPTMHGCRPIWYCARVGL